MVKKIDFHVHTIANEKKDYEFHYSGDWMKEYVTKNNLDAIAITNHDLFDKENFEEVKRDLPDTLVLPGIELSLEKGHVNIIFSEDEIDDLVFFSNWIEAEDLDDNQSVSVVDYCENMNNWEKGIYIFEFGKKNHLVVPEELSNVTAVNGVPNQLKFHTVYKSEEELTPVLFSDAHATDYDPDSTRNNIKLLGMKNTYIQIDNVTFSEIKNCITDRTKVSVNSEYLKNVFEINGHRVSTGLNLIVGRRGTGKTYFLNKIKKQYDEDEIFEIAQFETANADSYIEKQRKEQGQNAFNNWRKQFEIQFNAIRNYLERDQTEFNNEIDTFLKSVKVHAESSANSKSSSKFRLSKDSNFEEFSTTNLENYLNKTKELINSTEMWEMLSNKKEKRQQFIKVYNELRDIFLRKSKRNILQYNVNNIMDGVKSIIEHKTGIQPVIDCELSKIIKIKQLEKKINEFLKIIIKSDTLHQEIISGYQIVVKISPFKNASQFQKKFSTNIAVKEDLIDPYLKQDYILFLNNLKHKDIYNSANLEEYLMHLDVNLLDEDGTPASGGQAVGFSLMMRLNEAKHTPLILVDEPEGSLDNVYIRDELIKKFKELSQDSTVFVITHNSTLGTLMDPDYVIITTKTSNNYDVLTGEFSSNLISNIHGNKENSFDKFVNAMEAGIETYQKKGEIYGSLKN